MELFRLILYFIDTTNETLVWSLRFLGSALFLWDFTQFTWSLDLPFTFRLSGQRVSRASDDKQPGLAPVVPAKEQLIGKVLGSNRILSAVESISSTPCIHDIAIAKFDQPMSCKNYCEIGWGGSKIDRDQRLFMVGVQSISDARSGPCEGAIGGIRYHVNYFNFRVQPDCTAESSIIWRLVDETVEADSGAMLIATRNGTIDRERPPWEVVAFQDSNLCGDHFDLPTNPLQPHYWKLGGRPYEMLGRKYTVYIPQQDYFPFRSSKVVGEILAGNNET